MTRPPGEPRLCLLGRTMQRLGCLPTKYNTSTQIAYPITIRPVDSGIRYSDDIKYKAGSRFPSPQPDEPKPQFTPYVTTTQLKSPRTPKPHKKTPVAQTVPLSTLSLPVNALPVCTPATTIASLHPDLPPARYTAPTNHTPYSAPLSALPRTPHQNAFPDSILQSLGDVVPSQYIWDTPHGALAYTPAPGSTLPLPNPLADFGQPSPWIAGVEDENCETTGFIPTPFSPASSDSSLDYADSGHRSRITLHPLLVSNALLPGETPIEWNVSEPIDAARHVLDDAAFVASAREPATNPPTHTLRIELSFAGQPSVKWNWEPINIRKTRPIRIADVLHAIYRYFQKPLTPAEFDIVKSYGRSNEKIVVRSWQDRSNSQYGDAARLAMYYAGLKRVDCLGSSKIFSGLQVDGTHLNLSLRA